MVRGLPDLSPVESTAGVRHHVEVRAAASSRVLAWVPPGAKAGVQGSGRVGVQGPVGLTR